MAAFVSPGLPGSFIGADLPSLGVIRLEFLSRRPPVVPVRLRMLPRALSTAGSETKTNIILESARCLRTRAESDLSILSTVFQNVPRVLVSMGLMLSLLCSSVPAWAEFPTTAPTKPFYDEVGLVSRDSSRELIDALEKLKETTGFDVKLALVRSLPYEVGPQEYAEELFKDWAQGPKDVVIVAGVRIARAGLAAGEDAAKLLTKEISESIGNETYAFHAGDESYSAAVLDVSNRIAPILNGKADPGPPEFLNREVIGAYKTKEETKEQKGRYTTVVAVLLVIAFIAPMVQYYWYVRDD